MHETVFASRLRQIRVSKRMTQKELAEYMDKNISTVNRWESGNQMPGTKSITRLAVLFGVSEEWLLGNTEEMKRKDCWADSYVPQYVGREELYRFRGEPVWLNNGSKAEWALVSKNEDALYLSDGSKLMFYQIEGQIQRKPSPLCYGLDSMRKPLSRSRLLQYPKIWAEEIGPDPFTKRRGWITPAGDGCSYKGESDDLFLLKDYGVKWIAFEDIC